MSAIPFFAPPEWAWQLLDLATGKITPLTTATARQLNFPIDAAATAQFTMPGSIDLSGPAPETALVKELATDIVVSRNGRPVFRGRVGTSADTHANDADTIQFTAVDYRGMLDHRVIWPGSTLVFSDTDESDIAWQMITDTQGLDGGDLGITEGTGIGTTGVNRDRTYTAGVPLGQTLDELANLEDGFEWEVDANLAFNVFYPWRFRDQTASQVLAYGRGLTAITSTVNTDAYANAVYYTGAQPATAPVEQVPPGGFDPAIGRWEMQQSDPNVVLQATADEQAKAARLNAQQLDPAFSLTMSPAWWEPGDIWLGDLVQVQVDDGRLDVDVARRVVAIDITLDDDGTETVVLTANVPTPPDTTTDPPPPPAPGGAGKVPKLSKRLHTVDHRLSKLELVAAQGGGDLPYYSGSKGPSTALDNAGTAILGTADIPTGRYLVTITATFSFSAADTMHLAFQGDTGAFFGAPLTITHTAVGNFGEVYSSSATYVMTVTSEGAFQLWGYQLNPTTDCTVLGNFISAGGQCVTGYTMLKIGNYP